jgi:hypothetical protein
MSCVSSTAKRTVIGLQSLYRRNGYLGRLRQVSLRVLVEELHLKPLSPKKVGRCGDKITRLRVTLIFYPLSQTKHFSINEPLLPLSKKAPV